MKQQPGVTETETMELAETISNYIKFGTHLIEMQHAIMMRWGLVLHWSVSEWVITDRDSGIVLLYAPTFGEAWSFVMSQVEERIRNQ